MRSGEGGFYVCLFWVSSDLEIHRLDFPVFLPVYIGRGEFFFFTSWYSVSYGSERVPVYRSKIDPIPEPDRPRVGS